MKFKENLTMEKKCDLRDFEKGIKLFWQVSDKQSSLVHMIFIQIKVEIIPICACLRLVKKGDFPLS